MKEIDNEKRPELISMKRIQRLREQGYCNFSNKEIAQFSFGNRFAYILCSLVLLAGIIFTNVPVISGLTVIAFFGIVLPWHPFDYIYNHLLAKSLGKPRIPPRSRQLKFACTVATICLGITAYFFYAGFLLAGYILGGTLFVVAFLVSTLDLCIPSMLYNYLFNVKIDQE